MSLRDSLHRLLGPPSEELLQEWLRGHVWKVDESVDVEHIGVTHSGLLKTLDTFGEAIAKPAIGDGPWERYSQKPFPGRCLVAGQIIWQIGNSVLARREEKKRNEHGEQHQSQGIPILPGGPGDEVRREDQEL